MAWLAILLFKMTILCCPFKCVKVNKTSASSVYGSKFGINFFYVPEETDRTQQKRLWLSVCLFVFSSYSLYISSFSLSLTLSRERT